MQHYFAPGFLSVALPRRSQKNTRSKEIGFEMWPSNRVTRSCRMGYQLPMNASDSICVRSRRIQGDSIARERRYRRRNLPKVIRSKQARV